MSTLKDMLRERHALDERMQEKILAAFPLGALVRYGVHDFLRGAVIEHGALRLKVHNANFNSTQWVELDEIAAFAP